MGPFGCTLLLYILGIIGVTFDLGKIPTKIREKISGAIGCRCWCTKSRKPSGQFVGTQVDEGE